MKFELMSYKSGRSKEPLMRIEVTIEELEYMYGLVDRESIMSDALYGLAGGTRKERSLMAKAHTKLDKMIQCQKKSMAEKDTLSCSTPENV
ncbi:MAG: hypothetical protein K2Y01_08160 [Rhabdochlamydiaceae bacterium]|nr:hypothetical protein [Rhabdochlamydiaceae bacterium]